MLSQIHTHTHLFKGREPVVVALRQEGNARSEAVCYTSTWRYPSSVHHCHLPVAVLYDGFGTCACDTQEVSMGRWYGAGKGESMVVHVESLRCALTPVFRLGW